MSASMTAIMSNGLFSSAGMSSSIGFVASFGARAAARPAARCSQFDGR